MSLKKTSEDQCRQPICFSILKVFKGYKTATFNSEIELPMGHSTPVKLVFPYCYSTIFICNIMFLLIIFVDYICYFQLIKVCFCNYEVEVIVHKHTYTREADAFEIIFEIKISIVVTAIFSLSDSSLETAFSIFL